MLNQNYTSSGEDSDDETDCKEIQYCSGITEDYSFEEWITHFRPSQIRYIYTIELLCIKPINLINLFLKGLENRFSIRSHLYILCSTYSI